MEGTSQLLEIQKFLYSKQISILLLPRITVVLLFFVALALQAAEKSSPGSLLILPQSSQILFLINLLFLFGYDMAIVLLAAITRKTFNEIDSYKSKTEIITDNPEDYHVEHKIVEIDGIVAFSHICVRFLISGIFFCFGILLYSLVFVYTTPTSDKQFDKILEEGLIPISGPINPMIYRINDR